MNIKNFWNKDFQLKDIPTTDEMTELQQFIQKHRGWIYIMKTTEDENILKIGLTRHDNPFKREVSLNRSAPIHHVAGEVHKWTLVYAEQVYYAFHVESKLHQHFEHKATRTNECFTITLEEAIQAVQHFSEQEKGLLGKYFNLELIDEPSFKYDSFYIDEWIESLSF